MSRSRGRHVGDVPVADQDPALGHLLEPGDHAQQRRLAAARRADQHHELPVADVEADRVHRLDAVRVDLRRASSWIPPIPGCIRASRSDGDMGAESLTSRQSDDVGARSSDAARSRARADAVACEQHRADDGLDARVDRVAVRHTSTTARRNDREGCERRRRSETSGNGTSRPVRLSAQTRGVVAEPRSPRRSTISARDRVARLRLVEHGIGEERTLGRGAAAAPV